MFDLLVNPAPKHDESLSGYLHRLGDCNGLWNGEVIKLFKDLTDEQASKWLDEDIRPVSWKDVALEIRSPQFNIQNVWSLINIKYCPVCLAGGFYWRELWDLTLYTTCIVHNVNLVYKCPMCQEKSTLKLLTTKCCDKCQHPVFETLEPDRPVDEFRNWISAELEKRLRHGRDKNLEGIDSLTYQQFNFLAIRLGVRVISLKCFMNMIVVSTVFRDVAPDLAVAAGEMFLGWPKTFHSLLTDLKRQRASSHPWKLGLAFGPIYNDVYLSLIDQCYDFIRSEFEKYVIRYWEGPLAIRNRRLSECTLLAHRWLPYNQAARTVGLPENFLRRMRLSGELDDREFTYPCGKTVAVVDIEEVRKLSLVRHEPLNLRETSRLLSLSRKRIEQLIDAGVLRFFGGCPSAGEKWLVDYNSIVALRPLEFLTSPGEDFLTISQIAKHYLPTSSGLVELVRAIQSGEISAFCRADSDIISMGKWLVSQNELVLNKILVNISSQEKGMSVANAAKMLGVKEEVAYAMVRLGWLRSDIVQCSRRSAFVVNLEAIQHFKRNYILAPEAALILNAPRVRITFKLQEGGFFPVAGPGLLNARCRQYVWRRSKKLVAYLATAAKP